MLATIADMPKSNRNDPANRAAFTPERDDFAGGCCCGAACIHPSCEWLAGGAYEREASAGAAAEARDAPAGGSGGT